MIPTAGYWGFSGRGWGDPRGARAAPGDQTLGVEIDRARSSPLEPGYQAQELWLPRPFDAFIQSGELKYAEAAQCLAKDPDALRVPHDFPAEHWKHLRTKSH